MSVALLSAKEQLALLQSGRISSAELVEEYVRRILSLNPALNAFADFEPSRPRAEAQTTHTGPLAGLPITIKSSIQVAEYRCEIGSTLRHGVTADQDAAAVAALRSAGAIVLGTTNCPEFLMAYETDNLLCGATPNPWDLQRSAGGSSGGEAAAIAAGLSTGGLGSDSGGSVREPAHFSGICALKPTPGRVSAMGHMPPCVGPFSSIGAVGPMARTIDDVELFFQILCDAACRSGESAPVPYRPVSLEHARGIRIGWLEDDGIIPVTPETRAAIQAAVHELEGVGFTVQPYRPASLETARRLWRIFFLQCGALFYASTIAGRQHDLSPIFQEFLLESEGEPPLSEALLLRAWAQMDELRLQFAAEMRDVHILLTPVCSVPAFRHGERAWQVDGQTVGYWDAMRYTQWFNTLAVPAAVVPVGQSAEGLPIGVQIAGRSYDDELVLTVAGVLDKAFGYRIPSIAK